MTNNNHNPCQISCATDKELEFMSQKAGYTPYYTQLIKEEIKRREQVQNYSNKHFLKGMMKI